MWILKMINLVTATKQGHFFYILGSSPKFANECAMFTAVMTPLKLPITNRMWSKDIRIWRQISQRDVMKSKPCKILLQASTTVLRGFSNGSLMSSLLWNNWKVTLKHHPKQKRSFARNSRILRWLMIQFSITRHFGRLSICCQIWPIGGAGSVRIQIFSVFVSLLL